jgi:hypothetical protein
MFALHFTSIVDMVNVGEKKNGNVILNFLRTCEEDLPEQHNPTIEQDATTVVIKSLSMELPISSQEKMITISK